MGKLIRVYDRKQLKPKQLKSNLIDFIVGEIAEAFAKLYRYAGVFSPYPIALSSSGADTFNVGEGQSNLQHYDGLGHILTPDPELNIPFENESGVTYYVACKYALLPDTLESSPYLDHKEWGLWRETIGEIGEPDSVTLYPETNQARLNVNSITEQGVNHSGRLCKVYLKAPRFSDGYFEATIEFDGTDNYVVITLPENEDASQYDQPTVYWVAIEGFTWRRNTDLSAQPEGYCYIGSVEGAGAGSTPSSFDTSGQKRLYRPQDLFDAFVTEHYYDEGQDWHGTHQLITLAKNNQIVIAQNCLFLTYNLIYDSSIQMWALANPSADGFAIALTQGDEPLKVYHLPAGSSQTAELKPFLRADRSLANTMELLMGLAEDDSLIDTLTLKKNDGTLANLISSSLRADSILLTDNLKLEVIQNFQTTLYDVSTPDSFIVTITPSLDENRYYLVAPKILITNNTNITLYCHITDLGMEKDSEGITFLRVGVRVDNSMGQQGIVMDALELNLLVLGFSAIS